MEQAYCTLISTGEWAWQCCLLAAVIINFEFILWNILHGNVLPHNRMCVWTCDCSSCLLAYWKSFADNFPPPANCTIKLILLQNMHFILILETCWLLFPKHDCSVRDKIGMKLIVCVYTCGEIAVGRCGSECLNRRNFHDYSVFALPTVSWHSM